MGASDTDTDLLIVGGGINGAGIARDAAGRGVRTLLIDQGDFGGATSSASTKLIHGGLRYLEHYEFRLVTESLDERAVMLRLAPHLVTPLRFVMPHVPALRPAWMIRLGLWFYDHLGHKTALPDSSAVSLQDSPLDSSLGAGLKPELTDGFSYFDARVDDARLVILNLKSACDHGATVLPRRQLIAANRESGAWRVTLQHTLTGERSEVRARVLVNAAGPWVKEVLDRSGGVSPARVRLVKGSHIAVPRVHAGDHAYIFQNTDQRVVFVIPYLNDYSLIGTTDTVVKSLKQPPTISASEVRYLLSAVNQYLNTPLKQRDIVWSYSGIRPLYDDGNGDPAAITRDYTLVMDEHDGAPRLSVFGGKLTTYRKLAEAVLDKLAENLDYQRGQWTDSEPLPGGAFDPTQREDEMARLIADYPRLPSALLRDWFARYGLAVSDVLNGAKTMTALGRDFGGGLYQREVDYLIAHEWAMRPDDILWRRTKAGLLMNPDQQASFEAWWAENTGP